MRIFEYYKTDFEYYKTDGEVTISKYTGKTKRIVIPSEIEGFPVTRIECEAFYKVKCESIVIPDSVIEIDEYAFSDCTMEKVKLSSNLRIINSFGFTDCCNLKSIVIPDSVTKMGWELLKDVKS